MARVFEARVQAVGHMLKLAGLRPMNVLERSQIRDSNHSTVLALPPADWKTLDKFLHLSQPLFSYLEILL
jgi:hypothetical protein